MVRFFVSKIYKRKTRKVRVLDKSCMIGLERWKPAWNPSKCYSVLLSSRFWARCHTSLGNLAFSVSAFLFELLTLRFFHDKTPFDRLSI